MDSFENQLKTNEKSQEASLSSSQAFSSQEGVKQSKNALLKERLRVLIRQQGLTEREFYHSLNMTRQYWYGVSWDLMRTPEDLKFKIAAALKTDSRIIWPTHETKSILKIKGDHYE